MRRIIALAAAALALSVVAAGCGGSDSEEDPTAAWASSFCSAVTGWTNDLQNVTTQFTDTSNLSEEGLQSAADDVKSSTQSLVDDLKGLGAPPTDSGDAVKSAIDDLSTTLEDESTSIEEAAQGISGLTGIANAITSISTSLATMATSFSDALTTIQNADAQGELQSALEDSPECADISSS
jgi:flagellar hook-basal body complex protein FliE